MEIEQKERERIEAKYPPELPQQVKHNPPVWDWKAIQLSRQGSAIVEHIHLQKEVIQPLRGKIEELTGKLKIAESLRESDNQRLNMLKNPYQCQCGGNLDACANETCWDLKECQGSKEQKMGWQIVKLEAEIKALREEIFDLKSEWEICPSCKGDVRGICTDCLGTGRIPNQSQIQYQEEQLTKLEVKNKSLLGALMMAKVYCIQNIHLYDEIDQLLKNEG